MAEKIDFEASLKELEKLVTKMSDEGLTLEESLQAYEQGIQLTNQCRAALEEAKERIEKLQQPDMPDEEVEDDPF